MPPAGAPRPDAGDARRARLVSRERRSIARRPSVPIPAGQSPHRLNRAEYANAIRDLLALEVDAATLLPPDDSADGFDNIADVLSVSPALLERYLSAAAKISALAVGEPDDRRRDPRPTAFAATRRRPNRSTALPLGTRGGLLARHTFPLDGEYVIKVKLLETNLGSIRGLEYEHQLEITVDGERVLLAPVGGPEDYTQSALNATNVVNALDDAAAGARAGRRRDSGRSARRSCRRPAAQGANRLQPFLRSTLDRDRSSRPAARREHHDQRAVQRHRRAGDTPSRRAAVRLPAREGRRTSADVRDDDPLDAGAARVSAAGDRRRT